MSAVIPGAAHVAIHGDGIAANCCAHLLSRAGLSVGRTHRNRTPVPAILLSDAALALLRSVFDRADLFIDRPRITRRIVAWGTADPVSLPHGAVVLSEGELDAALAGPAAPAAPAAMTIHTAPPFPEPAMRTFGRRGTVVAQVRLRHADDQSACWIEATETGWLFLIPSGSAAGWLLAVGAAPEALLDQSRHVAPRLELEGPPSAAFETSPRMLAAMAGPDWLACGSAAIAFDPICGDGTAQAVREAILASAVIRAMREGDDPAALRVHFESLMVGAMRRHLRLCAQFYASGGDGSWWRAQLADLAEGFDWCTARLAKMPEPRFELHGFRLVERVAA
ncbi:hypothetical protein [Phenylobacterium kunshanense]|uniref:hypothetical protein n=1 Tax=Phenylobacterium kunshanense TaxID=1445034 RepID=UPI00197B4756|nr:hypothetical protein [Phenylobacterium kunshanense]